MVASLHLAHLVGSFCAFGPYTVPFPWVADELREAEGVPFFLEGVAFA